MTDVRWEGLTHAEIYRRVQSGPGRGASLSVESAWSDTEALILGIEERLTSAVARSGGGWQGAAGDAARAGLSPLGNWAADAVGDARLTASGVLAQGEQAAWLRAAMPSPTAPLWDESPGRPAADPLYLMQDVQALEQRSADDTAQAVNLMNTYTGNSYENKRFLDYWTFPPSVTVEASAAPSPGPVPGDPVPPGVWGSSGPGGSGTGGAGAGPGTGLGSPGPGAAPLGVPGPAGGAAATSALPAAPSVPGPSLDGDRAGSAGGAVPPAPVPGGGGPSPSPTPTRTGPSRAGGGAAGRYPPGGTGPAPPGGAGPAPGGTRAPTGSAGGGARSATPDPRSIPAPWPAVPGARPAGPAAWPAGPGSPGSSRSTPTWRDLLPPPTGPRTAPAVIDGAAGARSAPAAGEPPARSVGAGVAAEPAARSGGGARVPSPTHPGLYPPMTGVGAGRPGGEHRRPDYLLDDTDAFADDRWFTPGVISADDPLPRRHR